MPNTQILKLVEEKYAKKKVPDLHTGDVVRVHQKIREGNKERIQIFEGVILKTQNGRGLSGTFTVRKIASGVGVERTFPLHSPSISKIERVKSIKTRRGRIYFIRERLGKKSRMKEGKKGFEIWMEPEPEPEKEEEASRGEEETSEVSQAESGQEGGGKSGEVSPAERVSDTGEESQK